jgi:hypothetical protein
MPPGLPPPAFSLRSPVGLPLSACAPRRTNEYGVPVVTGSSTSCGAMWRSSRTVTAAQLKASGGVTGTYADTDYTNACAAASKAIEDACGDGVSPRKFWLDSVDQARVYTAPVPYGNWPGAYSNVRELDIDDLVTLTSLTLDLDGDGVYETTWTRDTDFYLDPPNASNDSLPYERVCLRPQVGKFFPAWPNAVKVTGRFGWPAVPSQVTEYAYILAAQFLMRVRQAPFGVIMAGVEIGSSARISTVRP